MLAASDLPLPQLLPAAAVEGLRLRAAFAGGVGPGGGGSGGAGGGGGGGAPRAGSGPAPGERQGPQWGRQRGQQPAPPLPPPWRAGAPGQLRSGGVAEWQEAGRRHGRPVVRWGGRLDAPCMGKIGGQEQSFQSPSS